MAIIFDEQGRPITGDNPFPVRLSGSIPVLGVDGNNPVGEANPLPVAALARVAAERIFYRAANPAPGTTSADYDIRDTSTHNIDLDHHNVGVFEQMIVVRSTLDAEVDVYIEARMLLEATGYSRGPRLFNTANVAPLTANQKLILAPEVGEYFTNYADTLLYAVPDLRQPWSALRIAIKAKTTPTTGTINIAAFRRY